MPLTCVFWHFFALFYFWVLEASTRSLCVGGACWVSPIGSAISETSEFFLDSKMRKITPVPFSFREKTMRKLTGSFISWIFFRYYFTSTRCKIFKSNLSRTTSAKKQFQLQEKVIRFERFKKISPDAPDLYDRTGETRWLVIKNF